MPGAAAAKVRAFLHAAADDEDADGEVVAAPAPGRSSSREAMTTASSSRQPCSSRNINWSISSMSQKSLKRQRARGVSAELVEAHLFGCGLADLHDPAGQRGDRDRLIRMHWEGAAALYQL